MAAHKDRRSILDWDEATVTEWLKNIGLSQYSETIQDHGISGEVLTMIDHESLKEMGITSVGHRLAILKGVYRIKMEEELPIDPEHYVPPSEAAAGAGQQGTISLEKVIEMVKSQGERITSLEKENQRLQENMQMCMEEVMSSSRTASRKEEQNTGSQGIRRQPSFKWAQYVRPTRSPTRQAHEAVPESPRPAGSPSVLEHDISIPKPPKDAPPPVPSRSGPSTGTHQTPQAKNALPPPTAPAKTPGIPDATDIRSFKVSLDDPAWKVLPAALRKYKINNDDWQNYAMFICYGNTERCLSYDEKPLLLFQKLKDAKKNPVFMLKHIRDIRSPIAVAQQKQQARLAMKQETSTTRNGTLALPANSKTPSSRTLANTSKSSTSGLTAGQSQWPELMSPTLPSGDSTAQSSDSHEQSRESHGSGHIGQGTEGGFPPIGDVSYAIAIYPYMAEQEDEFDVAVDDTFIILSRAQGWWVVQRDPLGTGVLESENSRQGWVPAGCLLETSMPLASAIADAFSSGSGATMKSPILPLSIISTSFPGIALMDYRKKGDEELNLSKDVTIRVFKRYNHWSYAVKEDSGDRGWVPSWFIGKLGSTTPGTPGNVPSTTPGNTSNIITSLEPDSFLGSSNLNISHGSPVSPGFGSGFPMGRTTTTMI